MATKSVKKKDAQETISQTAKVPAKKRAVSKKTAVKKIVKAAPAEKNDGVKNAVFANNNASSNAYLVIDHPVNSETICGQHYAIRIGASPDGYVEISFNNGEWIPCRFGGGYWWFDWIYFTPGKYSIAVRLVAPDGNIVLETSPRICAVC